MESICQISLSAHVNALLLALQLKPDTLLALQLPVTLRLAAEEACVFDREETLLVESPHQQHVDISFLGKITSKTVTKTTYYHWKHFIKYKFTLIDGHRKAVELIAREAQTTSKTLVKEAPGRDVVVREPIDVSLTWLLKHLDDKLRPVFKIDRMHSECRTPRRNPQVEQALNYFNSFDKFCSSVRKYFLNTVFPVEQGHKLDLGALDASKLFLPVLPMYISKKAKSTDAEEKSDPSWVSNLVVSHSNENAIVPRDGQVSADKELLVLEDQSVLLLEHIRHYSEKLADLEKVFASGQGYITTFEAKFLMGFHHQMLLKDAFVETSGFIEFMLRKQLVAAIGKEVTASDFYKYMLFHSRKLFKTEYAPQPFCFAIRRPDHYPEGVLSFEALQGGDSLAEPIQTFVRKSEAEYPMQFAINAATKISFFGTRYLHLWMSHQFYDQASLQASLNARARQFSSFIMLVGNIGSSSLFLPKFGIVVQNKDDLKIPLTLERIPTAKEFRDAIESLSPEQQRFAKAYRSMQLESTMFGVVILQIKPQLEKLLNLPFDSLTKEIRLTQDLMELFIKYQIPSDLLSYSAEREEKVSQNQKVEFVKKQVKSMQDMLKSSKEKEIEQRRDEELYLKPLQAFGIVTESEERVMQDSFALPPPPSSGVNRMSVREGLSSKPAPSAAKSRSSITPAAYHESVLTKKGGGGAPVVTPSAPRQHQQESTSANQSNQVNEFDQSESADITSIPSKLDAALGNLADASVRPTIINVGSTWTRKSQASLLSSPVDETLYSDSQDKERDKAYDLLDALTRSGSLPFDDAELHVVIGLTHCFDQSLMDTVIQRSVNPIEKLEKTSILPASVIQECNPLALIKDEHTNRLELEFPAASY
jgi:hypothetical protein